MKPIDLDKNTIEGEARVVSPDIAPDNENGLPPGTGVAMLVNSEGWKWRARLNWLATHIMPFVILGMLASAADDVMRNGSIAASITQSSRSVDEKPGFIAGLFKSEAPQLDHRAISAIQPRPVIDLTADDVTPASRLGPFLQMHIESLNSRSRLHPDFDLPALRDISKPWVMDDGKPTLPLMKRGDGDVIWLAGNIGTEDRGRVTGVMPFIGVFRKTEGQWQWFNVRLPGVNTFVVSQHPQVGADQITRQMSKDFPELIAQQRDDR